MLHKHKAPSLASMNDNDMMDDLPYTPSLRAHGSAALVFVRILHVKATIEVSSFSRAASLLSSELGLEAIPRSRQSLIQA